MGTLKPRAGRTALIGLIAGVLLIPISFTFSILSHRDASPAEQRGLATEARQQADSIDSDFARDRAITLVTAHNPVFREFDDLPGSRLQKLRGRGTEMREANSALAYLETQFTESISEASFIDSSGAEAARAVHGKVAPVRDLATNEKTSVVFAPTFARPSGRVYQSRPYLSSDTHEWSIANATVVPNPRGPKSIVHFEIPLSSFQRIAAQASHRSNIEVIDGKTGTVVFDSIHRQRAGDGVPLGNPADHRFRSLGLGQKPVGTTRIGSKNAAFRRIRADGDNANDWYVFAVSRNPAPSWTDGVGPGEIGLGLAGLLLVAFSVASLRSSERTLTEAALTDALTGLPNRRALIADLDSAVDGAIPERAAQLVLLDLNGFKAYNDTFGHPAGDALLTRLAGRLQTAAGENAVAYRVGGDEFCVLATGPVGNRKLFLDHLVEAVSEEGEGFTLGTALGCALAPQDGWTASDLLRVADTRMYANKNSNRASAGAQTTDVLVRVLSERNSDLGEHLGGVAELCGLVAEQLGLPEEDSDPLVKAAALHDIGKAAIPDAIINKPGPLNDEEWEFMHRHTVVGERIMRGAPSLTEASKLVRSSHERWDGGGYPDRLAGEEIPLGSRVIAVCDAYDAMVSTRPYRSAMSDEVALDELRRCGGTQFDPRVVEAFVTALRRLPAPPLLAS
jgi:diguanylate cyclase (GGDEF)-like protein